MLLTEDINLQIKEYTVIQEKMIMDDTQMYLGYITGPSKIKEKIVRHFG